MKWITITEYVDCETGELIDKKQVLRGDYYVTKTERKTILTDHHAQRKFRNICKRTNQANLF